MEVERLDLYDYKLVLAFDEFEEVKQMALNSGCSIERVLKVVFEDGLYNENEGT